MYLFLVATLKIIFFYWHIYTGIAHEELTKAFEKTKRALKAVLKSKDMQMNDTISSLNHQHHHWRQQQRCDVISTFASSISNEVAQSKHVDLDSSMEHFKVCKQTMVWCILVLHWLCHV